MPDPAALLAMLDHRFAFAALAAAGAGFVRGFSGFGAAMVFVPVAAALYEPKEAVVLLFVMDLLIPIPVIVRSVPHCNWREILPLFLGATVALPLGVHLLLTADPEALRWGISLTILAATAALGSGWRYRGHPGFAATAAIGASSGLAGGIASLYGPPIILFWLGGQSGAMQVRANTFVYFGLTTFVSGAVFLWHGMFTWWNVVVGLALAVPYSLTMVAGTRAFRLVSDRQYRLAALGLCALISVAALPLWERL